MLEKEEKWRERGEGVKCVKGEGKVGKFKGNRMGKI